MDEGDDDLHAGGKNDVDVGVADGACIGDPSSVFLFSLSLIPSQSFLTFYLFSP